MSILFLLFSEGVFLFFSGWLGCGRPGEIDEVSNEDAAGTVDLGPVGVAVAAEVASFPSRLAGLHVNVRNHGVLGLPHEVEEEDKDQGEPLPDVEVNEHVVQAEGDTEVVHVHDVWVP